MIRVLGFHHVTITVNNIERTRKFYGGILGLCEIPRPGLNFSGAWYQVGDGQLHIIVNDEPPKDSRAHMAIEVEHFGKAHEELVRQGVEIASPPDKRDDDSDVLFCLDPDCNLIEVIHHESRPPST